MGRRKQVDPTPKISPDGFPLRVSLDKLEVGMSIFVPCVNTNRAKRQCKSYAKKNGMELVLAVRVENGLYGLRLWRTV